MITWVVILNRLENHNAKDTVLHFSLSENTNAVVINQNVNLHTMKTTSMTIAIQITSFRTTVDTRISSLLSTSQQINQTNQTMMIVVVVVVAKRDASAVKRSMDMDAIAASAAKKITDTSMEDIMEIIMIHIVEDIKKTIVMVTEKTIVVVTEKAIVMVTKKTIVVVTKKTIVVITSMLKKFQFPFLLQFQYQFTMNLVTRNIIARINITNPMFTTTATIMSINHTVTTLTTLPTRKFTLNPQSTNPYLRRLLM